MSPNDQNSLSEFITLAASPTDKALLIAIANEDGDTSQSAIVRRLIRQEAKRRGITIPTATTEVSQPAYAD